MALTRINSAQISYAQEGTGAADRDTRSKLREVVSVLDFGAVADYDDGEGTDNTAAFQAAITAAGTGGGVYIPAGYYKLDGTLTIPSQRKIYGAGRNSTGLYWTGTGNMIQASAHPDGTFISDIILKSTRGTEDASDNTGFYGYTGGSNRHLQFERVFFRNFSKAGAGISDCYNIRFTDCRWTGCGNATNEGGGVVFTQITFVNNDGCNGAIFDNCYFGSCYASVTGDAVNWTTFLGSVFELNTYSIMLPECRDVTFIGCYAEGNVNPGQLQQATFINTLRDDVDFEVNGHCFRKKDGTLPFSLSLGDQADDPTVATGTMMRVRRNEESTSNAYISLVSGSAGVAGLRFGDTASDNGTQIRHDNVTDTTMYSVGGSTRWIMASSSLHPNADNSYSIGKSGNRVSEVYAGTATINTSDAREKTPVRELTPAEIAAASVLSKEIGAYKFLSAVEAKGPAAREHIGMTVQRAIEVMESHGLDPFGYGFICHDKWLASPERRDEDGELLTAAVEAGDRYSFRGEELLLFIARGFEARLSALESTSSS